MADLSRKRDRDHLAPRREKDRLYGRGACDAKGPFLAMVLAARRLRAKGATGIGFLLLVGEEVDHWGAIVAGRDYKAFATGSPRIVLGEPTSAKVVAAQKGLLKVSLRASGKAAHSAFPDRGAAQSKHRSSPHLSEIPACYRGNAGSKSSSGSPASPTQS